MKAFAALYAALDASTRTSDKTAALVEYFKQAPIDDACWAVYFLTGNRPRQAVPAKKLHEIAADAAGLPLWLFEEAYDSVGDLAETIHLFCRRQKRRLHCRCTAGFLIVWACYGSLAKANKNKRC